MEEQAKMQEAEIEEHITEAPSSEKSENQIKKNFRIELALILVLGFLLGMVVKTEAAKRITIGFNDYRVAEEKNDFDFAKMEKELAEKIAKGEAQPSAPVSGGSCGL